MLLNEDICDKKNVSSSKTYQNLDRDTLRTVLNVPEDECLKVRITLWLASSNFLSYYQYVV